MHDDEVFTAFARDQWTGLVRAGVVLGCALDEAQDLAQLTLVRCFTAWDRVAMARNRDAYVYQTLLNAHRDSRRRRWWGEKPTEIQQDHPRTVTEGDIAARIALTDAVSRALADLTRVNREVVVLRHLAQLSERRTAEILGVSTGTVKSHLSRALGQLARSQHLHDFNERSKP